MFFLTNKFILRFQIDEIAATELRKVIIEKNLPVEFYYDFTPSDNPASGCTSSKPPPKLKPKGPKIVKVVSRSSRSRRRP